VPPRSPLFPWDVPSLLYVYRPCQRTYESLPTCVRNHPRHGTAGEGPAIAARLRAGRVSFVQAGTLALICCRCTGDPKDGIGVAALCSHSVCLLLRNLPSGCARIRDTVQHSNVSCVLPVWDAKMMPKPASAASAPCRQTHTSTNGQSVCMGEDTLSCCVVRGRFPESALCYRERPHGIGVYIFYTLAVSGQRRAPMYLWRPPGPRCWHGCCSRWGSRLTRRSLGAPEDNPTAGN